MFFYFYRQSKFFTAAMFFNSLPNEQYSIPSSNNVRPQHSHSLFSDVFFLLSSFFSFPSSLLFSLQSFFSIRTQRSPDKSRDFKIHYGGLLLRLLWPWGTRLTTPFPPQTSNRLRFRCTATRCSASTCLYKNGYVRLYSTFTRQRFGHWQWFPSLVSSLHLPILRFASELFLERCNSSHKTK